MIIEAHGKINLSLQVTGKSRDGYHTLDMIMLPISLCDEVTITPSSHNSFSCKEMAGDSPHDFGLMLKTIAAISEASSGNKFADVSIKKNIPSGAGLGGASADAAAILMGLNRLWDCNLSVDELANIGLNLGADVPFFLCGGAARVQGIGEKIMPLNIGRRLNLCIVKPEQSLSTKDVFSAYDKMNYKSATPDFECLQVALSASNSSHFAGVAANSLQHAAESLCPEIKDILDALNSFHTAAAIMTGSGSASFGVFERKEMADKAAKCLQNMFHFVRSCTTCTRTLVINEE